MKPLFKRFVLLSTLCLLLFGFYAGQLAPQWKMVETKNLPEERHENAFVGIGDRFYLVGGRKMKPVEIYDPKTQLWQKGAMVPLEMHHFQAVTHKGEIFVIGAFTGGFPHETPIPDVYIYNPKTDQWRKGGGIPEGRRRGAAGVTVYQDKIYVVSGIIDGHYDGHVPWFDEYDPATGTWRQLPDAPQARDHFQAAIADNKLVVAGGRRSSHRTGNVLNLTVPEVNVYDFKSNSWKPMPAAQNIPTQRAGCTAVTMGNKVVVIGGESAQKQAHNQTEAFDVRSNTWQTLAPLQTGRHGTQAILYKNKVYIAAGSANQGGGPELNSMEVLE
ncbi:kelch repeat-containing protein [soil metagenome]